VGGAEANAGHNVVMFGWCLRDGAGQVVESSHADVICPTASVGKVLLLLAVADALATGRLDARAPLTRPDPVADSGLWQHLPTAQLTPGEAAVLVAAVSDNLATNALLEVIGLDDLQTMVKELGFQTLGLHDRVRDIRTADHPVDLSSGSAAEWCELMYGLATKSLISPDVSKQVLSWLSMSVDHSLVLAPFAFDPLVAQRPGWLCANKTGSDPGVRADIGVVRRGNRTFTYAAIATGETEQEAVTQLRSWGAQMSSALMSY